MGCQDLIPILFTGKKTTGGGQQPPLTNAAINRDARAANDALVVVDIMGPLHKLKHPNWQGREVGYCGHDIYNELVAKVVEKSPGARAVVILADRPTVPLAAKAETRDARSAGEAVEPYDPTWIISDQGIGPALYQPGLISMKRILGDPTSVPGPVSPDGRPTVVLTRPMRTKLMQYLQDHAAALHFNSKGIFGSTTVILDLGTDRILWLIPDGRVVWTDHVQYPREAVGTKFAEADMGIVQWMALLDGGWVPPGVAPFEAPFDTFIARSIDSDTVPTVVYWMWRRGNRTACRYRKNAAAPAGKYRVLWDAFHDKFGYADLGSIIELGHSDVAPFAPGAFVAACIYCGTDFFKRAINGSRGVPDGYEALATVLARQPIALPPPIFAASLAENYRYWTGEELSAERLRPSAPERRSPGHYSESILADRQRQEARGRMLDRIRNRRPVLESVDEPLDTLAPQPFGGFLQVQQPESEPAPVSVPAPPVLSPSKAGKRAKARIAPDESAGAHRAKPRAKTISQVFADILGDDWNS